VNAERVAFGKEQAKGSALELQNLPGRNRLIQLLLSSCRELVADLRVAFIYDVSLRSNKTQNYKKMKQKDPRVSCKVGFSYLWRATMVHLYY
jgi:hypothetical protein